MPECHDFREAPLWKGNVGSLIVPPVDTCARTCIKCLGLATSHNSATPVARKKGRGPLFEVGRISPAHNSEERRPQGDPREGARLGSKGYAAGIFTSTTLEYPLSPLASTALVA